MFIYTNDIVPDITNIVFTIGAFDGVHKGHIYIIKEGLKIAEQINGNFLVYTFKTHPKKILPYDSFKLLTLFEEKLLLLQKVGAQHLFLEDFNVEFSQTEAEIFVENIMKKFNIKVVLIGYDNKFGKDRRGSYETFLKYSDKYKFKVIRLDYRDYDSEIISSTKIRNYIKTGNIEVANNMLGYPYIISGNVVKGFGIGSKIGFPTINLNISSDKLLPPEGVYYSILLHENNYYRSLLSISNRPTLNIQNSEISIEAHVLKFNKNIYGDNVILFLFSKLRDNIKFANINFLKKQIEKDIKNCENYFDVTGYDIEIQNNLFLFNK